jgi:transposase
MVKAPAPEEEDHRRICRERKVLLAERVRHVNRIKGLLFSQGVSGYEPLRRDRRKRLDELRTGDGRLLLKNLKAQIGRELDRLELLLEQIKAVETERDALLAAQQVAAPAPAPASMLLAIKGVGLPPSFGRKVCAGTSTIVAKSPPMRGWRRRRGRAEQLIANRACLRRATRDCGQRSFSLLGSGCAISRNRRWPFGSKSECIATVVVSRRRPSWR